MLTVLNHSKVFIVCVALITICFIEAGRKAYNRWSLDQQSSATPTCIEAGVSPGNATLVDYARTLDAPFFRRRGNQNSARHGALEAMVDCQVGACPKRAYKQYKWYIRRYVKGRRLDLIRYFEHYGYDGASRVRSLYDTFEDDKIVAGLRERFEAQVIDLDIFPHSSRATVKLLLASKHNRLPLCEMQEAREHGFSSDT